MLLNLMSVPSYLQGSNMIRHRTLISDR